MRIKLEIGSWYSHYLFTSQLKLCLKKLLVHVYTEPLLSVQEPPVSFSWKTLV